MPIKTVIKLEQNIRVKYMNTLLEFSFFFSIVADLNYTAIDAFLVLATPPCEFRKDIYKIEFPHVTGGTKMKYVPYLKDITSNIWSTEADVLLTVIASQRWRSVVVFYQNHSSKYKIYMTAN